MHSIKKQNIRFFEKKKKEDKFMDITPNQINLRRTCTG